MSRRTVPVVWYSMGTWFVSVPESAQQQAAAIGAIHAAKILHLEADMYGVPKVEKHGPVTKLGMQTYKEVK